MQISKQKFDQKVNLMCKRLISRKVVLFWFFISILGIASSQTNPTNDLLVTFRKEVSSYKQILNQYASKIVTYKQWFKNYQSEILSGEIGEESKALLNGQLSEIWQEIERLEPLTTTGWLDALESQLDSNTFADAPPEEIKNWMEVQSQYINKIQTDVQALENTIEQIQQTSASLAENDQTSDSERLEVSEIPLQIIEEDDVLEATLLYLLGGLEFWGTWLEPNNKGLLPEAEGRFMVSSTPILQTGVVPGGIGVVGFAQPITISRGGAPEGFSENQYLYEIALVGYDDSVEDVFEQASYLDRLNYQYGVEVNGRVARVYRKSIEIELTLSTMLQKLGAPPEVAEIWVAEYAEISHLPQSIQLSWLIAGNPLAKDYQVYVKGVLETFDLNTLLAGSINKGDFSSPQIPSTEWVNQDPFWAEVQKQPLLNAFAKLLSDASEEIKRSFIVSLFFLEPTPLRVGATSKVNEDQTSGKNVSLRPKPFFWSEVSTTPNINNPAAPTVNPIIDPDQDLVAEAIEQKRNLIKYWMPGQGYQIIPWAERSLLNPNDQGTPYFIMAVTALPRFAPRKPPEHKSNYETVVGSIIVEHLPKNQPLLKVFVGQGAKDRRVLNSQGNPIYFADSDFLWTTEQLDNGAVMEHAISHHRTINSPYVVISIDNGPYVAGGLTQIKEIFENRQDYTIKTVVLKSRGVTHRGKVNSRGISYTPRELRSTWLRDTSKVAQNIFDWSSTKQNSLFVQSTHRFAHFEKRDGLEPEVKISSMVTWKDLPSNEELLNERSKWGSDVFLVRVREGYLLIRADELEYLQVYADEKPQAHTLLLAKSAQKDIRTSIGSHFKNRNLDCESVRVLAARGLELAYSPQCSLMVTESGWEVAQADEETQLATALDREQPIAIFRPEDKPPSALPINLLVDAEPRSIENLKVSTLVPIYDLEDLDIEEKEEAISQSIADSIGRTLQFFPNQKEFEVLMPEFVVGSRIKYTNIPPENPILEYEYDKIDVPLTTESKSITFYRLRENVVEVLPKSSTSSLELARADVITPTGEWNKDRIMELAQNFHQTHNLSYLIVESTQGKFYGGSLRNIKTIFKSGEPPQRLAVLVTVLAGTDFWRTTYHDRENLGWLNTASARVLEQSKSLSIDPNSTVTAWSANGKRQAVFKADGTLQIGQTVQWQTRPDNQTIKNLRKTWRGNMILVHVPNQGYFLAQPNEAKFLLASTQMQIDSLALSFDSQKRLSDIMYETAPAMKELPIKGSVRVLSPSTPPDLEETRFYDGVDVAFYLDDHKHLQIDWKRSGLELVQKDPKEWLNYAEVKSSPLVIMQWPDGERSLALFAHLLKGTARDVAETEPQFIVPAYDLEDLNESVLDNKEIEESIASTLQDTLRQASALWPNQSSFQIIMPYEENPRLYSQDLPSKIKSGSLGVIEVTRQPENTKIKYYYVSN